MRPATAEAFELAEGPLWDPGRRRLLWVDIEAGTVLEGELDGLDVTVTGRRRVDDLVGAVAVAEDGTLLVAARDRLVAIRPDGAQVEGPIVVPAGEARRLNDGATDPAGRFLVGTLALGPADDRIGGREVLVRWEDDGAVTVLDDDLRLSNGLAWATDGSRLYSVDSLARVVFVRAYDVGTGAVGPRSVHLELTGGGLPDGIAVDAADHLWVAVHGAGEVRRHAPDGRVVEVLAVPAPHTTSVAFAGDDLRTLVITTAREGLDAAQLAAAPDSGRLFTTRVDVPGTPLAPWNARPPGTPAP